MSLVTFMVGAAVIAENTGRKQPSGTIILAKLATVYRTCQSYKDTGVVTIHLGIGKKVYSDVIRFSTYFVRPIHWRIDWQEDPPFGRPSRYCIWMNDSGVHMWQSGKAIENAGSLAGALGEFMGLTGQLTAVVPAILSPDYVSPGSAYPLGNPKLLGTTKIGTADCVMVSGTSKFGRPCILWIEKKRSFLRRVEFPVTHTSIEFKPVINSSVDRKVFKVYPRLLAAQ